MSSLDRYFAGVCASIASAATLIVATKRARLHPEKARYNRRYWRPNFVSGRSSGGPAANVSAFEPQPQPHARAPRPARPDYVQAHLWLTLAAPQFEAGCYRDEALRLRAVAEKRMTFAQIAEAQRLARGWMPSANRKPVRYVPSH